MLLNPPPPLHLKIIALYLPVANAILTTATGKGRLGTTVSTVMKKIVLDSPLLLEPSLVVKHDAFLLTIRGGDCMMLTQDEFGWGCVKFYECRKGLNSTFFDSIAAVIWN